MAPDTFRLSSVCVFAEFLRHSLAAATKMQAISSIAMYEAIRIERVVF